MKEVCFHIPDARQVEAFILPKLKFVSHFLFFLLRSSRKGFVFLKSEWQHFVLLKIKILLFWLLARLEFLEILEKMLILVIGGRL